MILNRCRRTTPPGTREIISKKDKDKQMKPNAQALTAFARQEAWDFALQIIFSLTSIHQALMSHHC